MLCRLLPCQLSERNKATFQTQLRRACSNAILPHNMAFHTTFCFILLFVLLYGSPFIQLASHVTSKSPWLISDMENSASFMSHCHGFDSMLKCGHTNEMLGRANGEIYGVCYFDGIHTISDIKHFIFLADTCCVPPFECNVTASQQGDI